MPICPQSQTSRFSSSPSPPSCPLSQNSRSKLKYFLGEETDRIENFAPALLTELQGAVDQFCSPYYYWRWRYAPINCKPGSSFSGLTKNNSINGQSYHHNPLFGLQRSWWGYTTGEEFDHLSWPILSFLSGRTIRILLVKSPMEVLSGWSGGEDAPPGSLNVIGLILEGGLSNSHKWSNQSYESFHTQVLIIWALNSVIFKFILSKNWIEQSLRIPGERSCYWCEPW